MKSSARGMVVWGVLLLLPAVASATINHGNFGGGPGTIGFLAVTETTATPGDPEPLFGPPIFTGDGLVFNPVAFVANAPPADTTSSLLTFMIDVPDGMTIHNLVITEVGDYSLLGQLAAAQIATSVILSSDPAGTNIIATKSFGELFVVPAGQIGKFDIFTTSATIPLGASGSNDIWLKMDNTLQAIAPDGSAAFIQKKIVSIKIDLVPEPSGIALIALGSVGLLRRRR